MSGGLVRHLLQSPGTPLSLKRSTVLSGGGGGEEEPGEVVVDLDLGAAERGASRQEVSVSRWGRRTRTGVCVWGGGSWVYRQVPLLDPRP